MMKQEKREMIIREFERFVQEYSVEYTDYNEEVLKGVLALLKAQEPETLDAPKPDDNIGCWYDIYTVEQVVSALKSRELCEDAVSRKYLLGQSYSIKFQTIDESDEEAYSEKVVCVEDIEDAPSVQPVPVARVMTLEEVKQERICWIEDADDGMTIRLFPATMFGIGEYANGSKSYIFLAQKPWALDTNNYEWWYLIEDYGEIWRCWTSKPTDEQREKVKWE